MKAPLQLIEVPSTVHVSGRRRSTTICPSCPLGARWMCAPDTFLMLDAVSVKVIWVLLTFVNLAFPLYTRDTWSTDRTGRTSVVRMGRVLGESVAASG